MSKPGHVDAELTAAEDRAAVKRRATLTAQMAMAGFELRQAPDGAFVASRWNLAKALPDLDAVAAFAKQVGAWAA